MLSEICIPRVHSLFVYILTLALNYKFHEPFFLSCRSQSLLRSRTFTRSLAKRMRPNWSICLWNFLLINFAVFSIYILLETFCFLGALGSNKMKIWPDRYNINNSCKGRVYHFDYWVMKNQVTVPVPLTHVPFATCIAANRKRSFRHTYILVTTQANELWLGKGFDSSLTDARM